MPEVSLASVNLASVCIESVLYGGLVVLVPISLCFLVRRQREREQQPLTNGVVRRPYFATFKFTATLCMFVSITVVSQLYFDDIARMIDSGPSSSGDQ